MNAVENYMNEKQVSWGDMLDYVRGITYRELKYYVGKYNIPSVRLEDYVNCNEINFLKLPIDYNTRMMIWVDVCSEWKYNFLCPNCNRVVGEEDNFCMYCGCKL